MAGCGEEGGRRDEPCREPEAGTSCVGHCTLAVHFQLVLSLSEEQ